MKFILRSWAMSDLDNLVQLANNSEIAKNLTNQFPHPYTSENGKAFISRVSAGEGPKSVRAIDYEGRAIGAIGIHPQEDIFCKNAEMGYWLAQPYWGKGIMTQAIIQTVEYGFQNWEIDRIFARPFGSNIGSQKVLEKAGFILEGRYEKTIYKNGQYEDELVYAIRRK